MDLQTRFESYFIPPVIDFYLLLCGLYAYNVYKYMKNYNSEQVKKNTIYKYIFVIWNFIASIFSLLCFVDIIGDSTHELITYGFHNHLCDPIILTKYPLIGLYLYVITKPLEFIDTFLLMLYNKKIIFLHWYHHILTVLSVLFIAVNTVRHSSMGLWFAIINLFVHTIMYAYYALTAFKNPLNGFLRRISYLITILQLAQMFIGTWIVYKSIGCERALENKMEIIIYGGMYISYIVLFTDLLLKKINFYAHLKK